MSAVGISGKLLCDWGRECGTEHDDKPCLDYAVGIVAVKDGGGMYRLSLCYAHRTVIIGETASL